METYGELKQAIKTISLKQKGIKIGGVALDTVLAVIPGIGAAKSTFDFVKAAFSKPDTKKSKSWLDKLDVDDEVSAIIDDTVENGFLKAIAQAIDSESDETALEQNFNMNQKMVDYLKKEYSGRTVTGIRESKLKNTMRKLELKQLIKEALLEQVSEETSDKGSEKLSGPILSFTTKMADLDSSIDSSLLKQAITLLANGKGITNIKHKDEVVKTFNAMMKSGDPSAISKIFMTLKQLKVK
tara:strand:- start:41 stop:763 length:723 start_codon:yes stop_codon:yes gene_type:complete